MLNNKKIVSKSSLFLLLLLLANATDRERPQSKKKLLPTLAAHMVGELLGPAIVPKFKMVDTQWSKMKIFENFFPNEGPLNIFRNVQTRQFVWVGWKTFAWKSQGCVLQETTERSRIALEKILQTNLPWGNRLFYWFQEYSLFRHLPSTFENKVLHVMATNVNLELRGINEYTSLLLAVKNGAEEAIHTLLARRAQVDAVDMFGKTALLHAVSSGKESICKILLRNNANANINSNRGVTPLTSAVKMQNIKMVRLILDESHHLEMKNLSKALKLAQVAETYGGTSAGMRSARECTEIITDHKTQSQKRKRKRDKNDNQYSAKRLSVKMYSIL